MPALKQIVPQIRATKFFGDASSKDIEKLCRKATSYSQGFFVLAPGGIPDPIGIRWTTNGRLDVPFIRLSADHDRPGQAAEQLLERIKDFQSAP